MNDNQKSFLSFVLGAAAGVAAGMLLAPQAGKESRKKITDTASSLTKNVEWEGTLQKITEFADSALATITKLSKQVQENTSGKVSQTAKDVNNAAQSAKDVVNKTTSTSSGPANTTI
jgi:gas vesicle protein